MKNLSIFLLLLLHGTLSAQQWEFKDTVSYILTKRAFDRYADFEIRFPIEKTKIDSAIIYDNRQRWYRELKLEYDSCMSDSEIRYWANRGIDPQILCGGTKRLISTQKRQ